MGACGGATPLNDRRKYLQISKKLLPWVKPFKKLILGDPLNGSPGVPPNYVKMFVC